MAEKEWSARRSSRSAPEGRHEFAVRPWRAASPLRTCCVQELGPRVRCGLEPGGAGTQLGPTVDTDDPAAVLPPGPTRLSSGFPPVRVPTRADHPGPPGPREARAAPRESPAAPASRHPHRSRPPIGRRRLCRAAPQPIAAGGRSCGRRRMLRAAAARRAPRPSCPGPSAAPETAEAGHAGATAGSRGPGL